MSDTPPFKISTISAFHKLRGLPKPQHPLISVVNIEDVVMPPVPVEGTAVFDFYTIAIKRSSNVKYKYGQQSYDFDEGVMFFTAPGQVMGIEASKEIKHSGWILLIHPDFLWNTHLAQNMRKYEFFDYAVNEALFLSEKEEQMILDILLSIYREYSTNIDNFSQNIIISQIELLLNHSERFYHRQFITRKKAAHGILERMEQLLDDYFNSNEIMQKGLPTVAYISESLNISPNYLRGLLNVLTGQNTQQHIHDKLIEKAKDKLSSTKLTVSEIAYELGFEHPQSFSKLFKNKTQYSPLEFRQSFN
jgi:AraC family transcriptional activator of pobA